MLPQFEDFGSKDTKVISKNHLENFWDDIFCGRVSNFLQSEARKQCFLASDWLKFETLPQKYPTLDNLLFMSGQNTGIYTLHSKHDLFHSLTLVLRLPITAV